MQPKFIYIESYGCSANQNNTEIIKGLLRQAGLELTESEKIADIIIINTCIVKGPTEKKMERRISDLLTLKKPIIVAGCMPDVRHKQLEKIKNLFLLSNKNIRQVVNLIKAIQEKTYKADKFLTQKQEIKLCLPKISNNRKIGITQISEGCLGYCNFCITRLAKGKLFSYPEDKIIENIKFDLKQGCKEIWLTSQDNASYGLDKGKRSLPELLDKILSLEIKFKIRLGMMNPENILPILNELIECFKHEKMYKFLHIPVQSGSNKILKAMNRQYTVNDFLKIIRAFKKEIPEIIISTDIIVAYPSETEEDFKQTLKIIKEIRPGVFNTSRFWAIKGTSAEKEKQLPEKISKKRATEVQKLHLQIALQDNKKLIGKEFLALVSDGFKGNFLARNNSYKIIIIKSEKNLLGKFIKVKIKEAFPHYLIGEIIS